MSYSFSRQKQSSTSSLFDQHQLYILTIGKSKELRRAGYQVVEVWECDYDKRYKEDPDFRTLEFTDMDHLRPRDALFEGRTNSNQTLSRN